MFDDPARLRGRLDELSPPPDEDFAPGAPCLFVRTRPATPYPTAVPAFFACETIGLLGAEVEGGAGTKAYAGDTVYAYLWGKVPPAGTELVIDYLGHRWGARFDG